MRLCSLPLTWVVHRGLPAAHQQLPARLVVHGLVADEGAGVDLWGWAAVGVWVHKERTECAQQVACVHVSPHCRVCLLP